MMIVERTYVPVDRCRPLGSEDGYAVLTSPVDWEDLILTCLHGTWCVEEEACRGEERRTGGLNNKLNSMCNANNSGTSIFHNITLWWRNGSDAMLRCECTPCLCEHMCVYVGLTLLWSWVRSSILMLFMLELRSSKSIALSRSSWPRRGMDSCQDI